MNLQKLLIQGVITIVVFLFFSLLIFPSFALPITYSVKDTSYNGLEGKIISLSNSQEYNLSFLSNSLSVPKESLLNVTLTKYIGNGELELYLILNKSKIIQNSYNCNCTKTTLTNSTIINECKLCYRNDTFYYLDYELINLKNLSNLVIPKNAKILEVFKPTKIEKREKGFGYLAYSDLNILENNIPNATWWNETYLTKTPIIITNNGSQRVNELTIINISSLTFATADKYDLIVVSNDTDIIPYQFLGNKSKIVILTNTSNATTYDFSIYSNNSLDSTWHNTTSIINIFDKGLFEDVEGYINGQSVDGINNWDTNLSCGGTANHSTYDLINNTFFYRDNSSFSLPMNVNDYFNAPDSANWTNNLYITYYIAKSLTTSWSDTQFNYYFSGGGRMIADMYYGYPSALAFNIYNGDHHANGTNAVPTWSVNNHHLITNGSSNFTIENSSYAPISWINYSPKDSQNSYLYGTCMQSTTGSGSIFYDNWFVSTTLINQYVNYSVATLGTQEYLSSTYFIVNLTLPVNNSVLTTTNVTFSYIVKGTNNTYNCTTYLNGSILNNNDSVLNNTAYTFYYTLNDTYSYTANVSCSVASSVNVSSTNNFTIALPHYFSIQIYSPYNLQTIHSNNPTFNYRVIGTESSYNCSLYVNDTLENTSTATNNTYLNMNLSTYLDIGIYEWFVNCTSFLSANQSATNTFAYSLYVINPNKREIVRCLKEIVYI